MALRAENVLLGAWPSTWQSQVTPLAVRPQVPHGLRDWLPLLSQGAVCSVSMPSWGRLHGWWWSACSRGLPWTLPVRPSPQSILHLFRSLDLEGQFWIAGPC